MWLFLWQVLVPSVPASGAERAGEQRQAHASAETLRWQTGQLLFSLLCLKAGTADRSADLLLFFLFCFVLNSTARALKLAHGCLKLHGFVSLFLGMRMHTHVHTHTRMHAHMHAHTLACMHICKHIHACTHMHAHMHTNMHALTCMHTYASTHACMHAYTQAHTHTHTHTHIHTHTHTHTHMHRCIRIWV